MELPQVPVCGRSICILGFGCSRKSERKSGVYNGWEVFDEVVGTSLRQEYDTRRRYLQVFMECFYRCSDCPLHFRVGRQAVVCRRAGLVPRRGRCG